VNQSNTGLFIQEVRKGKGLTQKELADRLGVSDKAVSKWETGRSMPDTSLLEPLCEELGISINELLIGESLPPEDYVKKAEVTIMNLYSENQQNKKVSVGQIIMIIIGALLAMVGVFLLFVSVAGLDMSFYVLFLDAPTIIILLIGIAASVLLSQSRNLASILTCVKNVSLPIAFLETIIGLMAMWNSDAWISMKDNDAVSTITEYLMVSSNNYMVAALPLVYGFCIFIIASIWVLAIKNKEK
jgi:transcriptional regulator with XRE-family HTH domain